MLEQDPVVGLESTDEEDEASEYEILQAEQPPDISSSALPLTGSQSTSEYVASGEHDSEDSEAVDIYNVRFCGLFSSSPCEGDGGHNQDARDGCTERESDPESESDVQVQPQQPEADCDVFNVKFSGIHVFT